MKKAIRHRILVLLALIIVTGGISIFLNNVSFNPDFSVVDALSGATKRSKKKAVTGETISMWKYTIEDVALKKQKYTGEGSAKKGQYIKEAQQEERYIEKILKTEEGTYRILENESAKKKIKSKKKEIILLSNKENSSYQKAVKNIASYLKKQGDAVRIKECTETMMLSMVHAGDFTVFVMSEEEQ